MSQVGIAAGDQATAWAPAIDDERVVHHWILYRKEGAPQGDAYPCDVSLQVSADFVAGCRERGCTPHVSQNNTNRRSAIDGRTTRHPGYRISTVKRKRIEEPFGWIKTVGGLRKTRHCGRRLVEWFFVLTATAYNLIRIPKILAATA